MSDPIVVEAWRGGRVESAHRGAGCVCDADGRPLFAFGDVERPIFPRSSVKAFQALPLAESGAGLSDAELALACASHSGEAGHVALAAAMLARAGANEQDLCCGAHWPLGQGAQRALAASGAQPTALHNNCSGKHAGFLCLCADRGWPFEGYVEADHPAQEAGRAAMAALTGERLDDERRAIDGCSIPTYAVSLKGLARGFARFSGGAGLSRERAAAAAALRRAIAANPRLIAGEGRFDTEWMTRFASKSLTKTGAEGVFVAALPQHGLGIAVKAEDGATRAAEVMIAALIVRFAGFDEAERSAAKPFVEPGLRNWRGLMVGSLKPAGPLAL